MREHYYLLALWLLAQFGSLPAHAQTTVKITRLRLVQE